MNILNGAQPGLENIFSRNQEELDGALKAAAEHCAEEFPKTEVVLGVMLDQALDRIRYLERRVDTLEGILFP